MKRRKRISLMLIVTLLMTLFSEVMPVMAAETTTNIQLVKDTSNYGDITTGQIIYFGQYTKEGGSKASIPWRVMDKDLLSDERTVTLMSESILEYRRYDPSNHCNWSGSEVCKYLNSQDTYTSDGFLTTAFTSEEQEPITVYSNTQESGHHSTDTFKPNQKIVLPSVNEVIDSGAFGWKQNSDRVAQDADGYKGRPTFDNNQQWWLRSPGNFNNFAAVIGADGGVGYLGGAVHGSYGIRPVMKLGLSSVLFTSDTVGTGAKSSEVSSILKQVVSASNEKKLTIINRYDESSNPTGQKAITVAAKGKYIPGEDTEVEINYSGATTGANQYLSAMITDDNSGALKYYGVIKALPTAEDTKGTIKV